MGILEKLREKELVKREFVSTGSLVLDYIISGKMDGSGGWPLGSFAEISGDEAAGKTFCALQTVASFQKKFGDEGFIFYDDVEGGINPEFAEKIGVDINATNFICTSMHEDIAVELTKEVFANLAKQVDTSARSKFNELAQSGFASSYTIWECFQRILAICRYPEFEKMRKLFVIDSLANLAGETETDRGFTMVDQGQRAKEVRQGIRAVNSVILSGNLLLVVNHVIYSQTGKSTSSGKGFDFASNVRLQFTKPSPIKEGGKVVGVELHAHCLKTRWAAPFQEAHIELFWERGVPKYSGLVPKLVELGKLVQRGGWYYLPGREKAMREREVLELIENGKIKLQEGSDE